jgi:hypothetical protein
MDQGAQYKRNAEFCINFNQVQKTHRMSILKEEKSWIAESLTKGICN